MLCRNPQNYCYSVLPPPLIFADASFTSAICRHHLAAPACCHTPPYLVIQAALQLPGSLASGSLSSGYLSSGYLASGGLSPARMLTVPSMPRTPDSVSVRCTPPYPWHHGGEGYWNSLLLVKSNTLRSHKYSNMPTSSYY